MEITSDTHHRVDYTVLSLVVLLLPLCLCFYKDFSEIHGMTNVENKVNYEFLFVISISFFVNTLLIIIVLSLNSK